MLKQVQHDILKEILKQNQTPFFFRLYRRDFLYIRNDLYFVGNFVKTNV